MPLLFLNSGSCAISCSGSIDLPETEEVRIPADRLRPAIVLALNGATASAQIYRVAEMNTEQLRALDRTRTVVLLPGGILEQHGPYLPSFADGYMSQRLTETTAEAIVARAGWKVLVFPLIPLGVGGRTRRGEYTSTEDTRALTTCAPFRTWPTEIGEGGVSEDFLVHFNWRRATPRAGQGL